MALIIPNDRRTGPKVGYWTLRGIDALNFTTRRAEFTLLGFADKAASKQPGAPIETRNVTVRDDDFDKFFRGENGAKEISMETLYEAARATDELFREAEKG